MDQPPCRGLFHQRPREHPAVGIHKKQFTALDSAQNQMPRITSGAETGVARQIEILTATTTWLHRSSQPW